MLKDYIKDNSYYIVSGEVKKAILNYVNENKILLNLYFITKKDLINKIYFSYDEKAIYYLAKEYNMSFENSKLMINYLKYTFFANNSENENYNKLLDMRKFLDKNNLLKYDKEFINHLNNFNIYSDLDFSDPFLNKINSLLNNKIIMMKEKVSESKYKLFDTSDEEINYLAKSICFDIEKGIDINNIHILNYNDSYFSYFHNTFSLYNLKIDLNEKTSLYNLNRVKKLILEIDNIEIDDSNEIDRSVRELYNKILFIDDINDRREFLKFLCKEKEYKVASYVDIIDFSNSECLFLDNHKYYLIGFNNKLFPSYRKNEDFIDDVTKKEIGYLTSFESNKIMKEYYKHKLNFSSLTILSREKDYFNTYMKNELLDEINYREIKSDIENEYSYNYDRLLLGEELDNFYKYNIKSDKLLDLVNKLDIKEYKKYDNSYKNIDAKLFFKELVKNNISISYSSFNKFNECSFKYYLSRLLKDNENSFATYVGSLFHYVLEGIYDSDFDFNKRINDYHSDYELKEVEKILLPKLISNFKEIIHLILEQYNRSNFKDVKVEKEIAFVKDGAYINGRIDKMFIYDNMCYVVDYKTSSNNKLTLKYLDYGLKLQLPFYFYLLKSSKEYANLYLVGCYLQIIPLELKSYTDNSKEMSLLGYTIDDANIVECIDNNYLNDCFIKGIKVNSKGLGTYAKLFNDEDIEIIVDKISKQVDNMNDLVSNANFKINPKIISNNETTCNYCKYKDICFRQYKDYIDIRGDEDELD